MTVRNLANISFDELLSCFLAAFENYYVQMPTDKSYYKERWRLAKVDYNYSYGMFDKNKLVGFIIHAIDKRNGTLIAFNTGTGVLPSYRGKKIVKSIYQFALKDLEQNGIEKITLEVIRKNEIAVKTYKSIGFEICKNYQCFTGIINVENTNHFDLEEVELSKVKWENLPSQQSYSWDFQKETILEGNYRFFQIVYKKEFESFFIINPVNHYLVQFDVLNAAKNSWQRLFSAIKKYSDTVKVINVDDRFEDKIIQLHNIGLENFVNQYEMELNIKDGHMN